MTFIVEQKQWIAVLGGATRYSYEQVIAAYKIGHEVANLGRNLLTGGTTGIPYAAAIGAKHMNAMVVGISPASSFEEHLVKYKKPLDYADLIVYTGAGVAGRSPILIQSACGAIFVGGEFGTLNEFTAAWMHGRNVIGVLKDAGGISDQFQSILANVETTWGSKLIFDDDPVELARRVCAEVDKTYSIRASNPQFEGVGGDVRNLINNFLGEEGNTVCVTQSASIPIGVSSTTNLL